MWRKACDSSAFTEMKKAKFYCYLIKKKENGKFLPTYACPPASLSEWITPLSLNWWSDKVGLNSRRRGTHSRSRNMCFTSGAPSYTRANVSICTDVCVSMPIGLSVRACVCVCVWTGVQHVSAISYQLLISTQQRMGNGGREQIAARLEKRLTTE